MPVHSQGRPNTELEGAAFRLRVPDTQGPWDGAYISPLALRGGSLVRVSLRSGFPKTGIVVCCDYQAHQTGGTHGDETAVTKIPCRQWSFPARILLYDDEYERRFAAKRGWLGSPGSRGHTLESGEHIGAIIIGEAAAARRLEFSKRLTPNVEINEITPITFGAFIPRGYDAEEVGMYLPRDYHDSGRREIWYPDSGSIDSATTV
ncbi:hypothetical protein B0H17DRAFT_1125614 [Mycena rosella]|uniref:Uncharacterized protein n=1 Tax=Mycena rosella TaxID=1033263 RepID=A0AAD7GWK3_MYCRO|nr:hypothetical protein B0H17DRAFT_1125614 [Mycena rosella]